MPWQNQYFYCSCPWKWDIFITVRAAFYAPFLHKRLYNFRGRQHRNRSHLIAQKIPKIQQMSLSTMRCLPATFWGRRINWKSVICSIYCKLEISSRYWKSLTYVGHFRSICINKLLHPWALRVTARCHEIMTDLNHFLYFLHLQFSALIKKLLTLSSLKNVLYYTTLQSTMNAKFSLHGFWQRHENRLIKTNNQPYPTTYVWVSSQLPFTVD